MLTHKHKLMVLVITFLHVIAVSCHKNHIRRITSSILVRTLRGKIYDGPIDDCKHSVRQIELNWDKIQIFCEHFHKVDGKLIADSYFQTTSGINFRHCRANAREGFRNNCFDIPFDSDEWSTYFVSQLPSWYISSGHAEHDRQCIVKNGRGIDFSKVHSWNFKQPECSNAKDAGFIGMPKEAKRYDKLPNGPNYTIEECLDKKKLPKDDIDWKNIDMFCYHFKDYKRDVRRDSDAEQVTEMYFKAKGERGTFQFCHGLSKDFTSNCFPGPWDGWKKWTFEHGEVHGETSLGFLTINNVHCYSRDGVMGDLNGMKNWYKENERNCGAFSFAGFQNFERKKVNS